MFLTSLLIHSSSQYHSRLMTQCSLFYENRVRFRDQLALARSKWEAQKGGPEVGQGPRLDADMLSFLEKFEKSWEKTMRVRTDDRGSRTL